MSIFRSNEQERDVAVSALMDGELNSLEEDHVRSALRVDAALQARLDRFARVRSALLEAAPKVPEGADFAVTADRVRAHVERTLRVRPMASPWWRTSVSLPVPLLSAAAVLILLLAGVLTATVFRPGSTDAAGAGLAALSTQDHRINVHVNVDATHTDRLLEWLNEQGHTQQVTVQLPDQAVFQLRGDPVLVRREPVQPPLLEIVPLEDDPE